MLAVREIVLGFGLAAAANRQRDPRPWLLSAAAIDGAESVVVLVAIARRQLPSVPALGFAAADCGGALVAAGVLAQHVRDGTGRSLSLRPGRRWAPVSTPQGRSS
jgi:hypothetical protein